MAVRICRDAYNDVGFFAGALIDTSVVGGCPENSGAFDNIGGTGTSPTILDEGCETTRFTFVETVLLELARIKECRPTV